MSCVHRASPPYTKKEVPELAKQRSKKQRQRQTDAQFTVRLSPERLAYFQEMHAEHSKWSVAQHSHPGFASLEAFLSDVLESYVSLCAQYEDALDSIERQGVDLKFLAAKLAEAGGEQYRVVSVDEVRRCMAAGGGGMAPAGGGELPN